MNQPIKHLNNQSITNFFKHTIYPLQKSHLKISVDGKKIKYMLLNPHRPHFTRLYSLTV